jgi:hypothetical protein
VRKRALYLENNASSGGTTIMKAMIKDTADAIADLTSPTLADATTGHALDACKTVKLLLENSLPFATQKPSVTMSQVRTWLEIARTDLLPGNPQNAF